MLLDSEELSSLFQNKLLIDCVEIRLTQNTERNPLIYEGSGSIYQDENGTLKVKLIHTFDNPAHLSREFQRLNDTSNLTPGKIIHDSFFYNLLAKDIKGRMWTSSNISIATTLHHPAAGKSITSTLKSINNINQNLNKESTRTYCVSHFQGDHEVPLNEYEITNKYSKLNQFKTTIDQIEFRIKKNETNVQIECLAEPGVSLGERIDLFAEVLAINSGKPIQPILEIAHTCEHERTTINSVHDNHSQKLPPPIPKTTPLNTANFENFLKRYISAFNQPHSSYFRYWYRIHGSFSGNIENHALVLTTSIEGILKEFFQEFGKLEEEQLAELKKAKMTIGRAKCVEWIKKRLVSSLGQAKNPSAKNMLWDLHKRGYLPKRMVERWVALRNQSTHADSLEMGNEQLQKVLDDAFTCLGLFYRLLLTSIDYKAKCIDYSGPGWPEQTYLEIAHAKE